MPPNTLDLTEWVVVNRDDAEKKKERAKRIPVVMRLKITLKVAHAVDSEATSYSEASPPLGLGLQTARGFKLHGIRV